MRGKNCAGLTVLLLVAVLAGAEASCRWGLGLGDPPLSVSHPRIEYLFRPSSEYSRFGNRVAYNEFSMRSPSFPHSRAHPRELRVLALGDSVLNGGSLTDQSELATEQLRTRLSAELGVPVVVGNASAGSWGPPNLLAYVEEFGLFDADLVFLVLNGADARDVPTFEPVVGVHSAFPTEAPSLALEEAVFRYLPRWLPWNEAWADEAEVGGHRAEQAARNAVQQAIRSLIERIRGAGAECAVVLHPNRSAVESEAPDLAWLRELAQSLSVKTLDLRPQLRASLAAGQQPYRDDIHLNAVGQALLAGVLHAASLQAFASSRSSSRPSSDQTSEGRAVQ